MKATNAQNKSGGHKIETKNIRKQVFVERKGIEMHSLRIPNKLLFESCSLILSMSERERERRDGRMSYESSSYIYIPFMRTRFLQV